jgi:hypothetical protein
VRRLCALLLLTLSAWLLVAPLAAASAEQNLLPACCRRLGAHHCSSVGRMAGERQQAGFRSAGCMLMPHHSLALLEKLAGPLPVASLALPANRAPFTSTSALAGYARALAIKSPRGPPASRPLLTA